jgi:hypothetical protein
MMMLRGLIMELCGDKDSWDMSSMMGMGMGMGGMAGGMGRGMGMGGMTGGGFRSVPATGLPQATLRPHQTRHLPTPLVSLVGPTAEGRVLLPAEGEPLQVGQVSKDTGDTWTQAALKRLAEHKAPQSVAQLVLWHVTDGFSWETVAGASRSWANAHELALARQFVTELRRGGGTIAEPELGTLYWELTSRRDEGDPLADSLAALLRERTMLGLRTREGIPPKSDGPAVAVRIRLDEGEEMVQISASDPVDNTWKPVGKAHLGLESSADQPRTAAEVADAMAEAVLSRLVTARLTVGPRAKGKPTYRVTIVNASPLILNGLAIARVGGKPEDAPSVLVGISLPPMKDLTVTASGELVERLGLKGGLRPVAADLSGL